MPSSKKSFDRKNQSKPSSLKKIEELVFNSRQAKVKFIVL